MADFKQAIEWMKVGKKIRRPHWLKNVYINQTQHKGVVKDEDGTLTTFGIDDFEANDWEIYCPEHTWEEHGCARPLKKYWICTNCGEEEKEYETLSEKIFEFPKHVRVGNYSRPSNHTGTANNEPICEVSDDTVDVIVAQNVKNSIKRLRENLKKYKFKDELGHPLENCLEFKDVFGPKLTGGKL